jgi:uncharacterized protein
MLLMKTPSGTLPPEATFLIRGGTASTFPVIQGQLLTVENVHGGQVAALFAFVHGDPGEFLSPHHTRVFGGTFVLRMGTRLVTNRRRPILVLGRDSAGGHDLLLPTSPACEATVAMALSAARLAVPKIPDPVNLFMNVQLEVDGRLVPARPRSRPGGQVTFRVLIDATCVVSACATTEPSWSAEPPTDLQVFVHNHLLASQLSRDEGR